ncbi:MAG TPA: hypothetical protein VG755_21225 [Nannocystaceae bacterium]|nr:hypothetical protein [Nannocystaceae bacterium]
MSCGNVGPVRVLEFPDEAPAYADASVSRIDDDRLLWQLAWSEPDSEVYPWPTHFHGARITGRCGESPVELPGVEYAYVDRNLPGLILTKGGAVPYDVAVIDPDDVGEQHVLFAGVRLPLGSTKSGIVSFDDVDVEVGAISFRAFPDDPFSGPVAPTTLAEIDVPSTTEGTERNDAVVRTDVNELEDVVWVLTTDDEVVRISLIDGTKSIEQVGVRTFEISGDERWLFWEDLSVLDEGGSDEPLGRLHVRDRDEEAEYELWIGHAYPWNWVAVEERLVRSPEGWLRLDDLSPLDVPPLRRLTGPVGEQRRWLTMRFADADAVTDAMAEPSSYGLFDVESGIETTLYDHPGMMTAHHDDGIELMHGVRSGTPFDPHQSPIWFAPFDGSPAYKLARAATTGYFRMPDGRIVTPLHMSPDFRSATLMLIEPDTLEPLQIDDHVFVHDRLAPDATIWGDDVVLYSVADGERSGMWIARLPAE